MEWPSLGLDLRELESATLKRPSTFPHSPRQVWLAPLLSGGDTLLEGGILRLPGPINEKPADKPRSRPGDSSETGIAADRTKHRAAAGADGRAGQRPLLGWVHIGTSSDRQNDGRKQQ
jgi:hypothetical protein